MHTQSRSQGQLFSDFLRGDDGAFRTLYAEHAGRVYGLCRRMLGREDLADDVSQEVWMRVIAMREDPVELENPIGYIVRIARNLCLDTRKSAYEVRAREAVDFDDSTTTPSAGHREDAIDEETVRAALDEMPEAYREILQLNIYGGFSLEEIAEQTGSTPEATWQRASRARKRLREIVAGKLADEERAVARLIYKDIRRGTDAEQSH